MSRSLYDIIIHVPILLT